MHRSGLELGALRRLGSHGRGEHSATAATVADAHAADVDVEGEPEAIRRVEEGPGEADEPEPYSVDVAVSFIQSTSIGCRNRREIIVPAHWRH